MKRVVEIDGYDVTFDVMNPDASDPHHDSFDESDVEHVMSHSTIPPIDIDWSRGIDSFEFDVPPENRNKWVSCGSVDVGFDYADSDGGMDGFVATVTLPTLNPDSALYSDAVIVQTDPVPIDGKVGAAKAMDILLRALPELFPGIVISD